MMAIILKRARNLAAAFCGGYLAALLVKWSGMPAIFWVGILAGWFIYCALNGWFSLDDQEASDRQAR